MKGFGDVILIIIKFAELLLRIIVLGDYIKHSKEYFSRYKDDKSEVPSHNSLNVDNSVGRKEPTHYSKRVG